VAANGQELPAITPLNPQFGLVSSTPQAYFSNGPVLRQGNAGLPEGLVLPEGWTLRPLALGPPRENVVTYVPPFQNRPPPPAPTATVQTTSSAPGPAPGTQAPSSDQAGPIEPPPSSSEAPAGSDPATASSSKAAEPSSLASSWSFGNAAGGNEGEGSSSAVAGSSSEGVARRTATVEDAEDNGQ
jgi:E3 ubiquitin-protein ligase synoviolin